MVTTSNTATTTPAQAKGDGCMAKVKRSMANCWASTMTCGANAKESTMIKKLEYDIASRQKKFGVDYLTLDAVTGTTPENLQAVLDAAKADIATLQQQIDDKEKQLDANKEELQKTLEANSKVTGAAAASSTPVETTPAVEATSTPVAEASVVN
jgi:hypothetical protein